jgi:hypothetical protein
VRRRRRSRGQEKDQEKQLTHRSSLPSLRLLRSRAHSIARTSVAAGVVRTRCVAAAASSQVRCRLSSLVPAPRFPRRSESLCGRLRGRLEAVRAPAVESGACPPRLWTNASLESRRRRSEEALERACEASPAETFSTPCPPVVAPCRC